DRSHAVARVELDWPTVLLAIGIYGAFAAVTWFYRDLPWWLVLPLGAAIVCLQSGLQHEAVHGYPTRWGWLNYLIAAPALWLWLPYGLYRRIHLKHHVDENLTDPTLDPESNYLTPEAWLAMSPIHRALREVMMGLLGRMVVGPFYAAAGSLQQLARALRGCDPAVLVHWALHGIVLAGLIWWIVGVCDIPLGAYLLLFVWPGTALIQMRGYAEHRAAPDVPARTATIEAGPVLSFLFLYNNLHALHHAEPILAWHRRTRRYRAARTEVLAHSRYHLIDGYARLAKGYLFEAKEPLLHPALVRISRAGRGRTFGLRSA
ncbi:MAG TPA: fatty acid desaturase, partial [Dongiaceae bacterium]|nr:fatty acid desaturase [Dongiaceae bacterium]